MAESFPPSTKKRERRGSMSDPPSESTHFNLSYFILKIIYCLE